MMHHLMNRRRLFVNVALIALALIVLAMPATQSALAFALDECAEITEKSIAFSMHAFGPHPLFHPGQVRSDLSAMPMNAQPQEALCSSN